MTKVLLCFWLIACFFSNAAYAEDTEEPDAGSVGLVSWAWDIPKNLFDKYSISKYSYWPSGCPTSGGLRYVHLRDRDNTDDFHYGGYANCRPVAFYFEETLLIAGIYGGFDVTVNEGSRFIDVANPDDVVTTDNVPFSVGVSMLWMIPKHGLQVELEIGHYWCKMHSTTDHFQFSVPEAPGIDFSGLLRQRQEETGLSLFLGFRWMSERRWLTGIELSLSGGVRTGPVEIDTKINKITPDLLPFQSISVPSSVTPTDMFIGLIYVKALALDVTDYLPFFTGSTRQFIMVEPVGGVSYLSWHHGHGLVAGIRVNILETVGISYFHSFKQQNDTADVDVVRVEIGLEIGGRLSSLRLGSG